MTPERPPSGAEYRLRWAFDYSQPHTRNLCGCLWLVLAPGLCLLVAGYFGSGSLMLTVPLLLLSFFVVGLRRGWKTFAYAVAGISGVVALLALAVIVYDWRIYFPKHNGPPPLTVSIISYSAGSPVMQRRGDGITFRVDNGSDQQVDCYRIEHWRFAQVHETYSLEVIPPGQGVTLALVGRALSISDFSRGWVYAWQDGDRLVFWCRDYAEPFEYGGYDQPLFQKDSKR
jgi:hypothetical protein